MPNISMPGAMPAAVNPLYRPQVPTPPPGVKAKDVHESHGMMSGRRLMEAMGGSPKADVTIFGKTLKTNSNAYKGALEGLQNYQLRMGNLGDVTAMTPGELSGLKQELNRVVGECDNYQAKHANSDSKTDRRGVMGQLKTMAQAELANLDRLSTLTNTGGKGITVADGLALLRGGVTDCSAFNKALNDSTIDYSRSKDNFGSGKANSVSLIAYGADRRVVKGVSQQAEKLMAGESATGFNQKDMRTAVRNTASANVAQLMGCGSTIPKPDIVLHHGEAALAMKLAPGESLIHKYEAPVTDPKDIARYDKELAAGFHSNLKNYQVRKDDSGVWQQMKAGFKNIPYIGTSNPPLTASIQKGLLDLQTMDCLMAQMDRQPENIFIQIVGGKAQVTGIDNDMCMGKEMKLLDDLDVGKPLRQDLKSTHGGPPPLMSREMYDKVKAMTPEQFKAALGPQFTADEVSAAVGRLVLLKAHADTLEQSGMVVDNFETWTTPDPSTNRRLNASEFLMAANVKSYVQRDASTLAKTTAPIPLDMSRH